MIILHTYTHTKQIFGKSVNSKKIYRKNVKNGKNQY